MRRLEKVPMWLQDLYPLRNTLYLSDEDLHLQIRKSPSQAHTRSVSIRQRSVGMNAQRRFSILQPAFREELV